MKSKHLFTISLITVTILPITSTILTISNRAAISSHSEEIYAQNPKTEAEKYYPINANSETYGPDIYELNSVEPDLIQAEGADGTIGYIRSTESEPYPEPKTPEEAISQQNSMTTPRYIPLYDKDGVTVIGSFKIG